jgi:hypothetical protein
MAKKTVPEIPQPISIHSGLKENSRKEELAYDHPGHFQEYIFNHKLPSFMWESYELLMDGHINPSGANNPYLLLAPRDHTKSTIAESFALWKVGKNPLELVQLICSVTSKARERLSKVASCIKDNERFKGMFGNLYPNDIDYIWNRDAIEVLRDRSQVWNEGKAERDPTVAAFGIETTIEGGRATLQLFDDIVTTENSASVITRETLEKKFWMGFDPMLLPTGQQLIFGTHYHYADFYSKVLPMLDTDRYYTDLYPQVEALTEDE